MFHMQICMLNETTWIFGHLLVALLNMIHMQICLLSETSFMFGHLLVAAFEYVTVHVEVGLHDY